MTKTEMKTRLASIRSKALMMLNNPFRAAADAPAVVKDVIELLAELVERIEEDSTDGT